MKSLIVSDLHLSDEFDDLKYNYLKDLFTKYDQVIINGDFWEGGILEFEEFLDTKWNGLFPILHSKNAIYIYGNHDSQYIQEDQLNVFSHKQLNEYFILLGNGTRLYITHGDQFLKVSRRSRIKKTPSMIQAVKSMSKIENMMVSMTGYKGQSFVSNMFNLENKLITYAQSNLPEDTILVCGHIHVPKFSPEQKYINTGFIQHGYSSYLEVEEGKMKLIMENYQGKHMLF